MHRVLQQKRKSSLCLHWRPVVLTNTYILRHNQQACQYRSEAGCLQTVQLPASVAALDILAYRGHVRAGVSGQVCVNGVAVTGADMGRFAGYVLQDDVLPGSSTVQEYLRLVDVFIPFYSFDQPTLHVHYIRLCLFIIRLHARYQSCPG